MDRERTVTMLHKIRVGIWLWHCSVFAIHSRKTLYLLPSVNLVVTGVSFFTYCLSANICRSWGTFLQDKWTLIFCSIGLHLLLTVLILWYQADPVVSKCSWDGESPFWGCKLAFQWSGSPFGVVTPGGDLELECWGLAFSLLINSVLSCFTGVPLLCFH